MKSEARVAAFRSISNPGRRFPWLRLLDRLAARARLSRALSSFRLPHGGADARCSPCARLASRSPGAVAQGRAPIGPRLGALAQGDRVPMSASDQRLARLAIEASAATG
jgi:hypothetical protein